jgi:hypothetical protein
MAYNTGGIVNYSGITYTSLANDFQKEYLAKWDKEYDHPINTVEKDNKKYLQYELIGLNASHITIKKNFVNKTKTLYVTVEGKYKDEVTGFENEINIKLDVDYKTYNKVTWKIEDGILTIVLHEIKNDEPVVELSKINPWEID